MPDNISLEKILQIAQSLINLTRSKKIQWAETGERDTYLFSSPRSSVVVGSRDGDGELPMFVRVLDGDGDVVDVLNTEQWEFAPWFTTVQLLHTLARRSATDADRVLDDLLADLARADEPPF